MCGFQYDDIETVPGACALPVPGFDIQVLDPETGEKQPAGTSGSIAIKLPLPPGFMPTLFNNDKRFVEVYMEEFPGEHLLLDSSVGCVLRRGT
jgi:propionyl-CoA synthetase